MGFLYFVLKCVHVLAWPSFALGYPLCASIRAIETNSNHHMRKLITYWILFSLISLFELAFAKLIEWVPIWPYIKLVVICSLVLPRFKGAYYAYKSFVHPCLTVNLEEAIKKLSKPQETTILKTENFLSVAERYVKENGTEALEKLIATKGSIPKADVEEIKAIANAEEKVLAPAMQSKCKDPNFAQKDIKAVEPIKTNTASAVDPIPGKSHELPSSRIRQVESGEGGATQPSPAGTKGGYRIKGKMCYLRSEEERLKRLQEEEEARKLEEAEKRRKEEAERRKKLDEIAEKQRKKEQELEEKERLRREAILRGKPTDGPARPSELPGPGVGAGAGSATPAAAAAAAPSAPSTRGKYVPRFRRSETSGKAPTPAEPDRWGNSHHDDREPPAATSDRWNSGRQDDFGAPAGDRCHSEDRSPFGSGSSAGSGENKSWSSSRFNSRGEC